MLVYPQLTTGALSQFPIQRKRTLRTVTNIAADGSRIVYADPAGGTVEWRLAYTDLSDDAGDCPSLQAFHTAAEGSLNSFTFVDPAANLLLWSEDLTNQCWVLAPLLTVEAGVADPFGGSAAWHATNGGAGPQSIAQTLNAPAIYTYCFSVYVRAANPVTVTLVSGSNRAAFSVGPAWNRVELARSGNGTESSTTFGIELPAAASIDLFGPQVEVQAAASRYQTSTTGGVWRGMPGFLMTFCSSPQPMSIVIPLR